MNLPPNPKQAAGDLKVPVHLVPPAAVIYIAKALGEGVEEYGPWNWRDSDVEVMTYIAAALRHIYAFVEGEDLDPDSSGRKPHLAGALASLAIIVDAIEGGFAIDNRPPPNASVLKMLAKPKQPEYSVRYDMPRDLWCIEVFGTDKVVMRIDRRFKKTAEEALEFFLADLEATDEGIETYLAMLTDIRSRGVGRDDFSPGVPS